MRLVSAGDPGWLEEALKALQKGGVVALPTETVYGLAASLQRPEGVALIFHLKGRDPQKALPLQVATLDGALRWGFQFSEGALRLARAFWPGPLTLVLHRPHACPAWFAPDSATVALRIPDHPVTRALLEAWGQPLTVTSANRSGGPECMDGASVALLFAGDEDCLVIDAGPVHGGTPSTVVDGTAAEPLVLRAGPIGPERAAEAWHGKG